ncbi:hypothetical protein CYY_005612 [Polysphondylium violaceum]|uniref:CoA-transferase family III protein n=1 Tax=Polysphondylium violaceum TaxID=133409 RepID=A0A8J4PSN4_9MYCE|nr:hypothetical protein CYY_005612 [Polysphondylium violaceum]
MLTLTYKKFLKLNTFRYYCTNSTTRDEILNNKPLGGYKVLDMSRVLAGPWTTQLLGDLGADVIKVENVGKGDDTREFGPPFYFDGQGNKGSAYFSCANRNKKSITVDITKKEGQQIIHRLAEDSDVFVENFKVGGLKKYNLDYSTISKINPRIVYLSITGFGQDGPYKDLPGYDFSIQAMGGLMSITGDQVPYKTGVAIVDVMTGLYGNVAIQAALHLRNKTNQGQYIDLSLLDVQSAFLANQSASYLMTGENPKRFGNAHPSIVPYESIKTKDGFIVVAVGNNGQFEGFCNVLNLQHLINDPKFISNSSRVANRVELMEIINSSSINFETSELEDLFSKHNVPCSPINTLDKVFNHPQIKHRNMVWSLPLNNNIDNNHGNSNSHQNTSNIKVLDEIKVVGNPIHFSKSDLHSKSSILLNQPPPSLGQHTDSVLINLGYSIDEINDLKNNKII